MGLRSISKNLELDLDDKVSHINNGERHLSENECVFSSGAVAETLINSLLIKSNAPNEIDFLSLGVERAEFEVFKGINSEGFSFKFMLIEVSDLKRMEDFLNQRGYILEKQFSSHDYLFKYAEYFINLSIAISLTH